MPEDYGRRHRELRARLLPSAIGRPCARCGEPMLKGQPLDLDHTNDRKGYLGFSHSKCNRATAGPNAMGYAEQQAKPSPQPRSVTQW